MKLGIFLGVFLALVLPFAAHAHGGTTDVGDIQTRPLMMQYMEEQALGSEVHEEMEGLMAKMLAGEMTQAETERMTQLMNEYGGAYSTMMSRMTMGSGMAGGSGWGMMSSGGFGALGASLMMLLYLVWLGVGIFALIWFWKNIFKK